MAGLPTVSLPVPLYGQVFGVLRQRIVGHSYAEGEQLPTEDSLAAEFGVSRATIRQAVGELVRQGLVDRKQGRGTFVLPTPDHLMGPIFSGSLADLMAETRRSKSRDIELVRRAPIPPRIARVLDLDEAIAMVIRRTRTMDNREFAYTVNFVPPKYASLITAQELQKSSLMTLLETKGVKFSRAQQSIRAQHADVVVAEKLKIEFGSAVLAAERLLFDEAGAPVQFVQSWYPGDLYEYRVSLEFSPESGANIRSQLA